MKRVLVNSNFIKSDLLRGEFIYRVRRHNGTIVEGLTTRQNMHPTWQYTVQRKSKKKDRKEIVAQWGWLEAEVIEEGLENTLVALPDNQLALSKNSRLKQID